MHQLEVAGEFVDDGRHLAGEVGVAGVEAGADRAGADLAEQVHHVAHVAEHQVRQHVFQQQLDAEFAAARGDAVQ